MVFVNFWYLYRMFKWSHERILILIGTFGEDKKAQHNSIFYFLRIVICFFKNSTLIHITHTYMFTTYIVIARPWIIIILLHSLTACRFPLVYLTPFFYTAYNANTPSPYHWAISSKTIKTKLQINIKNYFVAINSPSLDAGWYISRLPGALRSLTTTPASRSVVRSRILIVLVSASENNTTFSRTVNPVILLEVSKLSPNLGSVKQQHMYSVFSESSNTILSNNHPCIHCKGTVNNTFVRINLNMEFVCI